FHRAELQAFVPWALPPAEDLARGADLRAVDANTVAVVPRGAEDAKDTDGKPEPYLVVRLHFADGRLSEREFVRLPAGETLPRKPAPGEGRLRERDARARVFHDRKLALAPPPAPDLPSDTPKLLVLPPPLRPRKPVSRRLALPPEKPLGREENGCYESLRPP